MLRLFSKLIVGSFFALPCLAQTPLPPYVFSPVPPGYTQHIVGTYSQYCSNGQCSQTGGDPIFIRTVPDQRIDSEGSLVVPDFNPAVPVVWLISPEGLKTRLFEIPGSRVCGQVDAHTLQYTSVAFSNVAVKPGKNKRSGFYLHSVRAVRTETYLMNEASCTNPPPLEVPQIVESSTWAVISLD